MLIDFIKKETYNYTQEIEDKVYVHPLFYATYSLVRKRLIEELGTSELLRVIEPNKPHYSVKMDLIPGQFTSSHNFKRRISEYDNELEKVEISEFFLKLLEILPSAYHYNLYVGQENSSNTSFTLEAPIGGEEIRGAIANHTITTPRKNFSFSYQRKVSLYEYRFFIDYSYLLLTLGNLYLKDISYKELSGVDDYLSILSNTVNCAKNNFQDTNISSDFLSRTLKRSTNEGRIAFFKKTKDSEHTLFELLDKEIREGSWPSSKFSKDSIMGNFDTLIRPDEIIVEKKSEQVNILRRLNNIYNITEIKADFQSKIQNLNYRSRERNNVFKREVADNFIFRFNEQILQVSG